MKKLLSALVVLAFIMPAVLRSASLSLGYVSSGYVDLEVEILGVDAWEGAAYLINTDTNELVAEISGQYNGMSPVNYTTGVYTGGYGIHPTSFTWQVSGVPAGNYRVDASGAGWYGNYSYFGAATVSIFSY
jgi:hypothetical protein